MRQKLRGIILAAVMLACAVPAVAYASAPDSGTLSIIFEKEDSNIKIDGASVAVYKIADMEPVGNTAVYTMLKQYSSFATMKGSEDVTFNGMTASASNDLAKRMSTAVSGPAAKGVTDKNGTFKTGKLPAGMYLVGQTGKRAGLGTRMLWHSLRRRSRRFLITRIKAVISRPRRRQTGRRQVPAVVRAVLLPLAEARGTRVSTGRRPAIKQATSRCRACLGQCWLRPLCWCSRWSCAGDRGRKRNNFLPL